MKRYLVLFLLVGCVTESINDIYKEKLKLLQIKYNNERAEILSMKDPEDIQIQKLKRLNGKYDVLAQELEIERKEELLWSERNAGAAIAGGLSNAAESLKTPVHPPKQNVNCTSRNSGLGTVVTSCD